MLLKIMFIIIFLFIYIHIYIHLYVSKYNELNVLNDINNDELTNKIYNKLPFSFNAEHIEHNIDLSQCIIENEYFIKNYEPYHLLEPKVKFFTNNIIYNTNKHYLHHNLHCRSFYKTIDKEVTFILIHPKYKDIFKLLNDDDHCNYEITEKNINYIKNSKNFISLTIKKDEILFVPNYWIVYYEITEHQKIEKIQYSTLLNQFSFFWDKLGYYFKIKRFL